MGETVSEEHEMSFEQAFQALQAAVDQLEKSDISLEQSLEVFERGVRLAQRCGEYLNQAELRVRRLRPHELDIDGSSPAPEGSAEPPS